MKKWSLITIKFGEDLINFTNGIMDFHGEDELEVLVEKNPKNLNSILYAGITFITIENSYRFYVEYNMLFGANV